jgi:hypothetical protein
MSIVVDPAGFDLLPGVVQRKELGDVQALVAQSPLKDSMCPFSVGFPGWIKSSFTPR